MDYYLVVARVLINSPSMHGIGNEMYGWVESGKKFIIYKA